MMGWRFLNDSSCAFLGFFSSYFSSPLLSQDKSMISRDQSNIPLAHAVIHFSITADWIMTGTPASRRLSSSYVCFATQTYLQEFDGHESDTRRERNRMHLTGVHSILHSSALPAFRGIDQTSDGRRDLLQLEFQPSPHVFS